MASEITGQIAFNVKKFRQLQGLTQEKLAELSGLHPNYISAIERQKRNISVTSLMKIAKALNVQPLDLIDEEHLETF